MATYEERKSENPDTAILTIESVPDRSKEITPI
jgi:hypothetical protein